MDQKTSINKGIIFALITACISGVAIFYAKTALVKIPPLILTTSRNLYVGLIFFILFIFSRRLGELTKITRKQLTQLIAIGMIGGSLPFYLFFSGLQQIGAQTANLIHKSLFIWVTVLAIFFLKEKPKLNYWIAFILIMVANYFIAPFRLTIGRGELMVFVATILWSIENIFAKKILQSIAKETVGLFRMGVGGLILLLLVILSGNFSSFLTLNSQQLITIVIGGTILFFYVFFWYKAVQAAPISLVTLMLTFSTVVGNILNGSLTKLKVAPDEITTSLLITSAVSLIIIRMNKKPAFK